MSINVFKFIVILVLENSKIYILIMERFMGRLVGYGLATAYYNQFASLPIHVSAGYDCSMLDASNVSPGWLVIL